MVSSSRSGWLFGEANPRRRSASQRSGIAALDVFHDLENVLVEFIQQFREYDMWIIRQNRVRPPFLKVGRCPILRFQAGFRSRHDRPNQDFVVRSSRPSRKNAFSTSVISALRDNMDWARSTLPIASSNRSRSAFQA